MRSTAHDPMSPPAKATSSGRMGSVYGDLVMPSGAVGLGNGKPTSKMMSAERTWRAPDIVALVCSGMSPAAAWAEMGRPRPGGGSQELSGPLEAAESLPAASIGRPEGPNSCRDR
jgi:hypothetical protein